MFDIRYGWGEVTEISYSSTYAIRVDFAIGNPSYTIDGRYNDDDINPILSLSQYTLEGFSQKRPIDWNELKGKWCKFSDREHNSVSFCVIARSNGIYNQTDKNVEYDECVPLTDEQIKILNL